MIYDCIIIGAGASGLMCAASIPRRMNGLILEKTRRPGTKLLMSGSGQCNITHAGSIKDFVARYGSAGSRIRKCLYRHSNAELTGFLEENGVATAVREDGKIFPQSMDARDVLDMLLRKAADNGFDILCDHPAESIARSENGWLVRSGSDSFTSRLLIIATGGCSYPASGSDGSAFRMLNADLGLDITPLRPALSPVRVRDYPYGELAGISFAADISIWEKDRRLARGSGSLLLTHEDFSGPAVLDISKYALPGCRITISYIEGLSFDEALKRIKPLPARSTAELANALAAEFSLPKRFCRLMTERYGSSPKRLAACMTGEAFEISSVAGFNRAMATCGGVELSQIDTATMESSSLPGLFIIGEALDVDGATGGYNLQFAYSSARAAGDRAAELLSRGALTR